MRICVANLANTTFNVEVIEEQAKHRLNKRRETKRHCENRFLIHCINCWWLFALETMEWIALTQLHSYIIFAIFVRFFPRRDFATTWSMPVSECIGMFAFSDCIRFYFGCTLFYISCSMFDVQRIFQPQLRFLDSVPYSHVLALLFAHFPFTFDMNMYRWVTILQINFSEKM